MTRYYGNGRRQSTLRRYAEVHKAYEEIVNELGDLANVISKGYIYDRIKERTGHLQSHIAQTFDIDPHGEELQYIGDDIVEATWDIAKGLLCDHCREHY